MLSTASTDLLAVRPAYPLADPADPSGLDDVRERLERAEAFGQQLTAAIDQLVSAVLEAREAADGQAQTSQMLQTELNALKTKVRDLEQQVSIDRAGHDLAQVSRMHPKSRSIVFVGTTYFGDNVKYAWLGVRDAARAQGIACHFLPHHAEQQAQVASLGGSCLPPGHAQWSPEDLHTLLSAAVVVTSDHLLHPSPFVRPLLAGARHVQLWHGVSIKEIGLRNLPAGRGLGPHLGRVLATCGPYAALVGTAARGEPEWKRWFAFEQFAAIGYPRNDVLYRQPTAADLVNVDTEALERMRSAVASGRRAFLYAPTFRDADRGRWLLDSGLAQVAEAVASQGDCLVVNLHPVEQPQIPQLAQSLPGVVFVKPRTDIYPLLPHSSALITDYSSLLFDYLHLRRPVLMFRPDHAAYTERSRKLFDDKLGTLPGPLAETAPALISLLRDTKLGCTGRHRATRDKLLANWFDHHDGASAERLLALLTQQLGRVATV